MGYLPLEVERLEKLQILDVRKCLEFYEINLCVTIDNLAKLMKVRLKPTLSIISTPDENNLSGLIPEEIGNLHDLTILNFCK